MAKETRTRSEKIFDAVNLVLICIVLLIFCVSDLLHNYCIIFGSQRGYHRQGVPLA